MKPDSQNPGHLFRTEPHVYISTDRKINFGPLCESEESRNSKLAIDIVKVHPADGGGKDLGLCSI